MKKKFYVTTPIYYVNASPHIGHTYTTVAADTLARYYRQVYGQNNVWFLTGTDEHGQKIQRMAEAKGVSPENFVDNVSAEFQAMWKKLGITNNDFIRTTQTRHIRVVQKALSIVHAKGDIYQSKYEGLYCTPDESFWSASQAPDGLCPDCKRPLEKISETNFFFRLSNYQDWLIGYIKEHPGFIQPEIRRNEVLSFLALNKLNDLCISRPRERLSWGIPLPFSPEHVTYVWFDALINYLSAVGDFDEQGRYASSWWDEDTQLVHLMAKDILRQHAIYWPIMLKALGVRQPDSIVVHGWWMMGQDKMSKSRGNVVSPLDMADKYGIEAFRYFLLRDVSFGMDGNFSEEAIIKRYNSDLANDLGNLAYRTLTMAEKYYQGKVPQVELKGYKPAEPLLVKLQDLGLRVATGMGGAEFDFSKSLEAISEVIGMANKLVEEVKPWNLAKENKAEDLAKFMAVLVEVMRRTAHHLEAFMPQTAKAISGQFDRDPIVKGNPLFPRIEAPKS